MTRLPAHRIWSSVFGVELTPIIKSFVSGLASGAVAGIFESSPRWSVVHVLPGVDVHGIAVGRRFIRRLGVVGVLALQDDGLFRFRVVPAEEGVAQRSEGSVRQAHVRSRKRAYAPRGHAFMASPVYEELCAICAEPPLHHDRERVQVLVERALGADDVRVHFRDGAAEIADVEVRPPAPQRAPVNRVPGDVCAERQRAWDALSAEARDLAVRSSGLPDGYFRCAAQHIDCEGCGARPFADCSVPAPPPALRPPYRPLTDVEWYAVRQALAEAA